MGKTIRSGERNIILKVMQFFENEKRNKAFIIPVNQVINRTCAATGISRKTILNIKKEYQTGTFSVALPSTSEQSIASEDLVMEYSAPIPREFRLSSPGKKRRSVNRKLNIDHFMICDIRDIVKNMCEVKKEAPTLKKVLTAAKRDLNFPGQRETLRKIMVHNLGFKLKKFNISKKV